MINVYSGPYLVKISSAKLTYSCSWTFCQLETSCICFVFILSLILRLLWESVFTEKKGFILYGEIQELRWICYLWTKTSKSFPIVSITEFWADLHMILNHSFFLNVVISRECNLYPSYTGIFSSHHIFRTFNNKIYRLSISDNFRCLINRVKLKLQSLYYTHVHRV